MKKKWLTFVILVSLINSSSMINYYNYESNKKNITLASYNQQSNIESTGLSATNINTKVNQEIKLTMNAKSDSSLVYEFHVYNYQTKIWTKVTEYDKNPDFKYVFTSSGKYQVLAFVREINSSKTYDAYSTCEVNVQEIDTTITSSATVCQVNENVNFKTSSSEQNLLYEYHVYDYSEKEWKKVTNYTNSQDLQWNFTKPGKYQILVFSRKQSTSVGYDGHASINITVQGPQISLSSSSINCKVDDSVKLLVSSGNAQNLLYEYHVYDYQTQEWKPIGTYTSNANFETKFSKSGHYQILVFAKYPNSQSYNASSTCEVNVQEIDTNVTSSNSVFKINQSVSFKASSSEPNLLYEYHIYDYSIKSWSKVTKYTSSQDLQWSFTKPGKYQILVFSRKSNTSEGYDGHATLNIEVQGPQLTLSSSSIKCKALDPVKLSVSAEEGQNLLYEYHLYDYKSKTWTKLGEYSTKTDFEKEFEKAGRYQVLIFAKGVNSENQYDSFATCEIYVDQISLSIKSSNENPCLSDTVDFTVSNDANKKLYYQYSLYDYSTKTWTRLANYTTETTISNEFIKSGLYQLLVFAKYDKSSEDYDVYCTKNFEVKSPKITITSLDASSTDVFVNKPVNFNINATGSDNLIYQYNIYDYQLKTWKVVTDYTSDPKLTYVFPKEGKYQVLAFAKNKYSGNRYDASSTCEMNVSVQPVKVLNLTSLSKEFYQGDKIDFNVEAEGGHSLLYQFHVYNYKTQNWTAATSYQTSSKFSWNFDDSGQYQVLVFVKDSTSSNKYDDTKTLNLTIDLKSQKIDETDLDYSITANLGQTINFKSRDNDGNTLYSFHIYDYLTQTWSALNSYCSNNTFSYNFSKSGRYQVLCYIKNKNSSNAYDSYGRISVNVLATNITNYDPNAVYETFSYTLADAANKQYNAGQLYDNYGRWDPASADQVMYYVNPANFMSSLGKLQFLILNYNDGVSADDLNRILDGKGILSGKGSTFLQAAKDNNISPIYLVSHALLETGNGTSVLANGGLKSNGSYIYGKPVYNMFGIGAVDSNPNGGGTKFAYDHSWFTPEAAILGGAKFVSQSFINNTNYSQNTLYKMKWNPSNPGQHEYATDIRWAYNQVFNMKKLLDMCPNIQMKFQYPIYKVEP